jgi:ribosomal protein L35
MRNKSSKAKLKNRDAGLVCDAEEKRVKRLLAIG